MLGSFCFLSFFIIEGCDGQVFGHDLSWYDEGEFKNIEGDSIAASVAFFTKDGPSARNCTDEERLTGLLFQNYASSLRPVYNSSKSVVVKFGMNLIGICRLDDVNQVLELSAWLEMSWTEERLQWNPDNFSGLKIIRFPTRLIWTPDIVLYNTADDFDRKKSADVRAMISHSGEIFLGPYVKLRSTCILDLTLYPYDEQQCKLTFGSWTYDSSQLTLVSKFENIELSQYVDSEKWELIDSSITHAERHHACCMTPYSEIVIAIKMRRRFLYNNLFDIFIPSIWLSFVCLLCFYLPPESGEKIALGITVLLAYTWFTWLIAEHTPRTSDFVPLISIYLTSTMLLSALVVGLQVFVLNVHNGLSPVLLPVPKWLRFVAIDCLAKKVLHIENSDKKKRKKSSKSKRFIRRIARLLKQGDEYSVCDSQSDCWTISEAFSDEIMDECFDDMLSELGSLSRLHGELKQNRPVADEIKSDLDNRLTKLVTYMSKIEQTNTVSVQIANEWRLVAIVVDRLAFWIFLVFTVSLTFGLLILVPLMQKVYPKPLGFVRRSPVDTEKEYHKFTDDY